MAKVELLPRQSFEIKLDNGEVIPGQFGSWAMNRLCLLQGGIKLSQLTALVQDPTPETMYRCVLVAAQSSFNKSGKTNFPYTDNDAADWVDQLGGILNDEFTKLYVHIWGSAEKKSESETTALQSSGQTYSDSQPQPE